MDVGGGYRAQVTPMIERWASEATSRVRNYQRRHISSCGILKRELSKIQGTECARLVGLAIGDLGKPRPSGLSEAGFV